MAETCYAIGNSVSGITRLQLDGPKQSFTKHPQDNTQKVGGIMPRLATRFREDLKQISNQWCERNNIPPGYEITLVRKATGRKVNNNSKLHRRVLPKAADDSDTLRSVLDQLKACFVSDLDQRRCSIELRRPNGTDIHGGTIMATIRQAIDVDLDAEDRAGVRDAEIERAQGEACAMIGNLEYGECLEKDFVARGVLRALVEEHGREAVLHAAEAEYLI